MLQRTEGFTFVSRPPRKIVCTIPTYCEAGNIVPLVRELLAQDTRLEVLVIDDDSPDGTWRLVESEAAKRADEEGEARLHLLHRTSERGRGSAGRDGFVHALEMGADLVVEMDADFSHEPAFVPALVEHMEREPEVGLTLGSRGVAGGRDAERGLLRRWLTRAANAYIRVVLGLRLRDCNSGFRCWRRSTLEKIRVAETFSPGPAIVQELLFKTHRAGILIAELPIQFRNRLAGESTLTLRTLQRSYFTVLRLRYLAWRGELWGAAPPTDPKSGSEARATRVRRPRSQLRAPGSRTRAGGASRRRIAAFSARKAARRMTARAPPPRLLNRCAGYGSEPRAVHTSKPASRTMRDKPRRSNSWMWYGAPPSPSPNFRMESS